MKTVQLFTVLLFIQLEPSSQQNILLFMTNAAPVSKTGCNIKVVEEIEDESGMYYAGETVFKILCSDYFDVD